jgi:hypothetical protein
MFSNNQEFYAYIRSLVDELEAIGEKQWSIDFRNALSISSASGEVFGELWLTLKKFRSTKIPQKLGIQDEIEKVIKELENALR